MSLNKDKNKNVSVSTFGYLENKRLKSREWIKKIDERNRQRSRNIIWGIMERYNDGQVGNYFHCSRYIYLGHTSILLIPTT